MLKITLTVEMSQLRESARELTRLADILDGGVNQAPEAAPEAPAPTTEAAPKRGRPPKAVQAAPAPVAPVNVPVNPPAPPAPAPDDLDLGFEDPKPAPAPVPAPRPGFTLENIIQLCKDHAQAKGRDATGAILQSFGLKSVRDLKPEQFEAFVLKLRG